MNLQSSKKNPRKAKLCVVPLRFTWHKIPLVSSLHDGLTASLSGKAKASATMLYPIPELALLSVNVRRCMPAAVAVVTQLGTQLLRCFGRTGVQASDLWSVQRTSPTSGICWLGESAWQPRAEDLPNQNELVEIGS